MLPDALDAPNDAEVYSLPAEPLPSADQVVITSGQSDEVFFLLYLCSVVFFLFVVGALLSAGAKRLGIRRLLSFAALLAGFAPAIFHAQYVWEFLLRVISSYPAATAEQVRMAVGTFTSTGLLYSLVLFLLGAVCVWRTPWTVLLAPFLYSTVYVAFPLRPLMAALVGTDITIAGLAHLWLVIHTVFVTCGILGWLLSRDIVVALQYRLERRLSQ